MASLEQERRTYDDGRYIFREHESGDQAFILVSGSVEIVRVVDNEIRVLATLGQGEIFGEMALIDDQPRMASARAAGQVTAAIISRDLFKAKLARTDPFIRALLKIFSEDMRRLGKAQTEKEKEKEKEADAGDAAEAEPEESPPAAPEESQPAAPEATD